jgi:hypothetical protein
MPEIAEAVAGLPPLWLGPDRCQASGRLPGHGGLDGNRRLADRAPGLGGPALLGGAVRGAAPPGRPSAEIRLLVVRPPLTMGNARAVAAELCAFGESVWGGYDEWTEFTELEEVAQAILGEPIWGFWWD